MTISTRVKELLKLIAQANDDYYNKNKPTVSDLAYDAWRNEVEQKLPECPPKLQKKAKQLLNSIGAMVGVSEWKKAIHSIPMLSLNKVNTAEQLTVWAGDCGVSSVFFTEKLDGISLNTIWEEGVLVQAITRGNGKAGEEITPNVKKMEGIPSKLKQKFSGNLRGEIILRRSKYDKHFADYKNPRNAASGVAKRYDGDGSEHLTVMMYEVAEGGDFKTQKDQFDFINKLGGITPPYKVLTLAKAIAEYKRYEDKLRDKLDYDIDGLVARVNDLEAQLALGDKGRGPKGAVAFKFDAEACETIIRKIVWQVGSTGRLTPVAEFDPVELAGATITRASLYNQAYINELGVDVGATVIVIRANDVIPRVEEVVTGTNTVAKSPKKCPDCGGDVQVNGEYIRCTNKTGCPAQALGRLRIWIKENNILDWGSKVLERALEANLVSDVGDLYRLTEKQLANLDRMGDRSASNLVNILDKHRKVPLENLIGGLGIDNVATSTTKLIIKAGYDTLESIYGMKPKDFEAIEGFGSIKAEAFYYGLKENKARIDDILKAGVEIKARQKGSLTGKTFCFTGKSSLPRPQLHKLVLENGGEIKKSVGRGVSFLVMADPKSTTTKAKAAKKFGTELISEEKFMEMIDG